MGWAALAPERPRFNLTVWSRLAEAIQDVGCHGLDPTIAGKGRVSGHETMARIFGPPESAEEP